MIVTSIGVTTPGCKDCKMLQKRMSSAFSKHGIDLQYYEIDYTMDEEQAILICEEYGFDDIPAFEVNGVVFRKGFDANLVQEAVDGLRNQQG